ncbi:MAG TPA: YraN family protein, partial [Phycisphaerae bacterium]|nr:YraN family protein [Phycisphaerae bacterium]
MRYRNLGFLCRWQSAVSIGSLTSMWLNRLLNKNSKDGPLGARGEKAAAAYLRRTLGMKILARNVLCPGGELDIVALDGEDLVFVEVRTWSREESGPPEKTITANKKRFLRRSARWYMAKRRLTHLNPRFDVVAIIWPAGSEPEIRYHRSA